ncbi:MAG: hypothetical protein Q8M92_05630 [Candidatus Subteraquimicrobiales bacterium]|nr:hypothetical protein [Candidatus Subteraquimicrobiales bacterium]
MRNLHLDRDGVWHDINGNVEMLNLSAAQLLGAVRVTQWKPSKVPFDCIDDFVYIVFYNNGDCRMVYRGDQAETVCVLYIKARMYGTNNYIVVNITDITPDLDGAPTSGLTSVLPYVSIRRRYNIGTTVSLTAPATVGVDTEFHRWITSLGVVISANRTATFNIEETFTIIAEYFGDAYIRLEDDHGQPVNLDTFYAYAGQSSAVQSYKTGGIYLRDDLIIYPPAQFQISLDSVTWVAYGGAITIPQATANMTMTRIYVRYVP